MGDKSATANASERLAGLQTVTTLLAPLRTPAEVAEVIVHAGAAAIGGHGGSLCLLDATGTVFELVHEVGYDRGVAEAWRTFAADAPVPAADAVRTRSIVVLRSIEDRDARYPVFRGQPATDAAHAVVPLFGSSGEPIGTFAVGWSEERDFDIEELSFLETLGGHCAQAIERARLYAEATQAAERQAFLAEVGRELSTSLDLETTLRRVVRLLVPAVADAAALHLLGAEGLRMVAVAHVSREGEEAMRALSARTGDVSRNERLLGVAQTGVPLVDPEMDDALLETIADDEAHLQLLKSLDLRSGILVPVKVKERVLGTVAVTSCWSSGRRLTEADLPFFEAVAERAALAIDNALAHGRLAQMADTLQQSLLPREAPRVPGLDVATWYRPVGEGGVGGDFFDIFPLDPTDGGSPSRWGVVIGDVAGKGIDAAALTALVRYTARAVAGIDPCPATVLAHCNRAVLAADIGERFATLLYAVVEPDATGATVTLAAGGHPLPVVRDLEGVVRSVGTPGPAVGLFPDAAWHTDTVTLGPGDMLTLFTDGLLEARSPSGEFAPYLLEQTLRGSVGGDAAGAARSIVAAVDAFEQGRPRDDLALVVLAVPVVYDVQDVVVRDVPVVLVVRQSEYLDELMRELELVRLGRMQGLDDGGYPHRLLVLVDELLTLWSAARESTRQQAEHALAAGRTRTDIHLRLPPIAAVAAEHFQSLLAEVEGFAATGRLLTVPPPEDVRRFQQWFLAETCRQLREGTPPSRYPFEGTASSLGRTSARWPMPGGTAPTGAVRHATYVAREGLAAPAEARRFLRTLGRAWALGECVEDALLPLSELVTNAVLYSGTRGEVRVVVLADERRLRVEVHDADNRLPTTHSHELDSGTGRGLQLVASITDRWGAEPTPEGKCVWFEVPVAVAGDTPTG